jgi:hypothetical protein
MNHISQTLARDMANPLVAPHMRFYPEVTAGPISETFQAERWTEYDPSQLTPMFSKGFKRFWIQEVARLADGQFIMPQLWLLRDGVVHCIASHVSRTANGCWELLESEDEFSTDALDLDYLDIQAQYGQTLTWSNRDKVPAMPNAMRKLVDDDEDLFVIMVSPWADDVSGNRSKQYNKHMNMYTGNGCLPGRLLQQEFHVHFVCSSPHASSAEQFAAFRDDIKATEKKPVKCFNAATRRKAAIIVRAPGLPADNPQQSEECSHMGSNANFPCRKCKWGGTKMEKETDQVYHAAHLEGVMRSAEEIRETLQKQLKAAQMGDLKAVEESQRTTGTKDKITQHWIGILLARAKEMKVTHPHLSKDEVATNLEAWLAAQPGDKMNPLLDIVGLDPSQDTPVELLHTILLGVMKYIWHHMNTKHWTDEDRCLLAIRLQSTDLSGLTVPPLRAGYMMQYKNNLIGKHFKTLMQILAFHVHGISTDEEFALILAAGELGALLWIPEIDDMEIYLDQLTVAIANLLDAFDAVDPLRILVKLKLHLLVHIPRDIRRFGPAIRFSTEIYEGFNAVFRLSSVYSNHQAPSRDIARKFAGMDRVKHLLSGGYWLGKESSRWIQAGDAVKELLQSDRVVQRHLGWVQPKANPPAYMKPSAQRIAPLQWRTSKAAQHWASERGEMPNEDSLWKKGQYMIAQSGDRVTARAWIVAQHNNTAVFGRIAELLIGEEQAFVTLEQFICGSERHAIFKMPVLRRPSGNEIVAKQAQSFLVLEPKAIQFVISAQHDCRRGECQPAVVGKERQEREETSRDMSLIKHTDDDHFLLNMAGLHPFVRLRRILGRGLTDIKPLFPDREKFHKEAAHDARATRQSNRQKASTRRRETAAAKRKLAEEAARAALEAEQQAAEAEHNAKEAEEAEARGAPLPDEDVPEEPDSEPRHDVSDSSDEEESSESEDEESVVVLGRRTRSMTQRARKRRRVG